MVTVPVVFYKRYQPSGMHVHYYFNAECCFVPALGVVFGKESSGSFQNAKPFYSKDGAILEEARKIRDGAFKNDGVEISKVRHEKIDLEKAQALMVHLRLMSDARDKAETILAGMFPDKE